MKKHLIDFPENNISIESFYDRLRPCYDSIMPFQFIWANPPLHQLRGHDLRSGSGSSVR